MTFVDLTKAFDTVSRDGLWKIMAKFGCSPCYIAMVRQFHDGIQARVQNDGEYSEPFPVTNGVKQGCVMAPTLFSMMFSVPSQFVLKSIRTQVNSYSFWSIRTQNFGQLVLIWSIRTHVWSVRTHFGQFVLILANSYSNSNEYELTKMSTN